MRPALASLMAGLIALIWFAGSGFAAAAEAPPAAQRVLVLVHLPAPHYRPGSEYSGGGYGDELSRRTQRRLADRIARAHGLTLVDDWPMPLVGLDCFVMATPNGADQAVAALARDPGVAWSQPMHLYHAEGQAPPTRGDPLFAAEPAAREWRLAELHKTATGRRISVAVIDSQVEANHPDLAGQVALSGNFTGQHASSGELHGTGVAGVIAAKEGNGLGIAGIAPAARLFALRACWEEEPGPTTVCDSISLAKALHFAIERRVQVINLSLAGPPDMLLGRLVDVALARGITVVAANDPHLPGGGFPASHAGVIRVQDESLAVLQPGVYTAPGRDVPTTQPGGRWSLVDGSSYAAAHVSGLVALLRERGGASGGKVTLASSRPMGGAIDACASLFGAARPCARQAAVPGDTRLGKPFAGKTPAGETLVSLAR
jgi:hypothetical protein